MENAASSDLDFPALRDPRYPIHKAANQLEPFLRAIVEKLHPEKIILFGSYAYGEPDKHSDFDLLVIRRNIESSKASNIEIRKVVWEVDAPPTSFTFLSRTPEEFDTKIAEGSFIYRDVAEKGVILYAA
jgi:predicted nucleotidyltransferase